MVNIKGLSDLNKRLVVSFTAIPIIGLLIAFAPCPLVALILVLVVAAFAAIGVWEYAQLVVAKGLKPNTRLMLVVAVCEVIAFFLATRDRSFDLLPVIVLAVGVALFFLLHFQEASGALVHIALSFFGICYIAVPLSFLLGILYPSSGEEGRLWLIYLIVVTKITDVGGYFVGRLWGKHPLAPVLSPKKTVEGAIAGFFCAILASVVMHFFAVDGFHLSLFQALYLGALVGIFGQIGDLAESLLKRDASVKDSNRLPGLGGVLDMVDSLLFTTPIVYLFVR
jgi:phosphatidate cytidylyltransferase